ncbi:hypothetical protein Landi51_06410 [Colletotrichum acutatum]
MSAPAQEALATDRGESSSSPSRRQDLAWLLERVPHSRRGPYHCRKAYLSTEDPIGEAFKSSSPAWLSYYITKKAVEGKSNFQKKAALRRRLQSLNQLDSEELKELALRLDKEIPPGTRAQLDEWLKKMRTGRVLSPEGDGDSESDTASTLNPPDGPCLEARAQKRQRTTEHDADDHEQPHRSRLLSSPAVAGSQKDTARVDEHPLSFASLFETRHLFPPYLAGAIARIPHPNLQNQLSASITMSYPTDVYARAFGYQMVLTIEANKIERIAAVLFDAHVELDGTLRYICLPGGTKIVPNTHITLTGCKMDSLEGMFGLDIHQAVAASNLYKNDHSRAFHHTSAVSMVVSHVADEFATITLNLELRAGTRIAERLYR